MRTIRMCRSPRGRLPPSAERSWPDSSWLPCLGVQVPEHEVRDVFADVLLLVLWLDGSGAGSQPRA